MLALAVLAGCASTRRDGPPANPPPGVSSTADAEPKLEPIRNGGPNKPYEVLGENYTPQTRDVPLRESGLASWYGRQFQGKRTASGEPYDMYAMTAAHKTMPLPSYARVRNPKNGREVIVRINDRGPFHADRVIDLSYAAAAKLDLLRGVAPVEVERITYEDIRTGAWRRGPAGSPTAPALPGPAVPDTAVADAAPKATPAAAPAEVPPPGASPQPPAGAAPALIAAADAAPATAAPRGDALPTPIATASTTASTTAAAIGSQTSPPATPLAAQAQPAGFWVQLGAFRERTGAESFQQRVAADLDWLTPLLAVVSDAPLFRLQAGPYRSRDDAQAAAQRVRAALQLVPLILERR